ncbi:hypothetical protein [Yersinia intermedia]|nr:hypothetical protein [Yersinia intermedia]
MKEKQKTVWRPSGLSSDLADRRRQTDGMLGHVPAQIQTYHRLTVA